MNEYDILKRTGRFTEQELKEAKKKFKEFKKEQIGWIKAHTKDLSFKLKNANYLSGALYKLYQMADEVRDENLWKFLPEKEDYK